jgi:hypothetical protein
MKREFAPYGHDWRNLGGQGSVAHCRPCKTTFNTNHEVRRVDGELVEFFSHQCPGCDSLDGVFRIEMRLPASDIGA